MKLLMNFNYPLHAKLFLCTLLQCSLPFKFGFLCFVKFRLNVNVTDNTISCQLN